MAKLPNRNNFDELYKYFTSAGVGMSPAGASGLLGNVLAESNGDPLAFNEGEGAVGIAQWRGSRADDLRAFAEQEGASADDLMRQARFMVHEFGGTESRAYDTFKNADDPRTAALDVAQNYTRPAAKHIPQRADYGGQVYAAMTGAEHVPTSPVEGIVRTVGGATDEQINRTLPAGEDGTPASEILNSAVGEANNFFADKHGLDPSDGFSTIQEVAQAAQASKDETDPNTTKRRLMAADMLEILSVGLGQMGSNQPVNVGGVIGAQRERRAAAQNKADEEAAQAQKVKQRSALAEHFKKAGKPALAAMVTFGGDEGSSAAMGVASQYMKDQFGNDLSRADTERKYELEEKLAAAKQRARVAQNQSTADMYTAMGFPDLANLALNDNAELAGEMFRDASKPRAGGDSAASVLRSQEQDIASAPGLAEDLRAAAAVYGPSVSAAMLRAADDLDKNPNGYSAVFSRFGDQVATGLSAIDQRGSDIEWAAILDRMGRSTDAATLRAGPAADPIAYTAAKARTDELAKEQPNRPVSMATSEQAAKEALRAAMPDATAEELADQLTRPSEADGIVMAYRAAATENRANRNEVGAISEWFNALSLTEQGANPAIAALISAATANPSPEAAKSLREALQDTNLPAVNASSPTEGMIAAALRAATPSEKEAINSGNPIRMNEAIAAIAGREGTDAAAVSQAARDEEVRLAAAKTASTAAAETSGINTEAQIKVNEARILTQAAEDRVSEAQRSYNANQNATTLATLNAALREASDLKTTEARLLLEADLNRTADAFNAETDTQNQIRIDKARSDAAAAAASVARTEQAYIDNENAENRINLTAARSLAVQLETNAAQQEQAAKIADAAAIRDSELGFGTASALQANGFAAQIEAAKIANDNNVASQERRIVADAESATVQFDRNDLAASRKAKVESDANAAEKERMFQMGDRMSMLFPADKRDAVREALQTAATPEEFKNVLRGVNDEYGTPEGIKTLERYIKDDDVFRIAKEMSALPGGFGLEIATTLRKGMADGLVAQRETHDNRSLMVTAMDGLATMAAEGEFSSGPFTAAVLAPLASFANDVLGKGAADSILTEPSRIYAAMVDAAEGQFISAMRTIGVGAQSDWEGAKYLQPMPSTTNTVTTQHALAQRIVRMSIIEGIAIDAKQEYMMLYENDPTLLSDPKRMSDFISNAIHEKAPDLIPTFDGAGTVGDPTKSRALYDKYTADRASGNITDTTLIKVVSNNGTIVYQTAKKLDARLRSINREAN
jgi:hypothetical protein